MTGLTFTGQALITSISIDAGVEENATYSISLTGTGAITKS
jgi:predicted secreted protein